MPSDHTPRPPVRVGHVVVVALLGVGAMLATLWVLWPGGSGIALVGPAASSDGYRLWAERTDGDPVRWNPCQPIDWVLNPDGAPDGAAELVGDALVRIEGATGLEFRYLGTTDERPRHQRPTMDVDRYGRDWAPVLVAWAPPSDQHALRPSDQGVAVPVAVGGTFVTAQVILNGDRWLAPDFADRSVSWGGVLVHEFGHVVGLDHVEDDTQLMYDYTGRGPVAFGDGDLSGLQAVGAGDGECLDAGRPRLVEVEVSERR